MLDSDNSCYSMILDAEIIETVLCECLPESPSLKFIIEKEIHHAFKSLLRYCIFPSTKGSCNRYIDYVNASVFFCVIKNCIQTLINSVKRKYDSFLVDFNSNALDIKHVMPYLGKTVKAMI